MLAKTPSSLVWRRALPTKQVPKLHRGEWHNGGGGWEEVGSAMGRATGMASRDFARQVLGSGKHQETLTPPVAVPRVPSWGYPAGDLVGALPRPVA